MARNTIICCSLWMLICPAALSAQSDEERISTAIRRGVQYLKSRQNQDGSWSYTGHEVGMTSLAALALVESGVPIDDAAIKQALAVVRGSAPSNVYTYDISLAIIFLARVGDRSDHDLIHLLGNRLAGGQLSTGGWTYVCPLQSSTAPKSGSVSNAPRDVRRPGRLNTAVTRAGFGDNSNTQFAVLGIWAAGRAGLDVRETMAQVDRRFRSTQAPSGGWGYAGVGDSDSMTCAGLMSLVLAKGQKVLEGQMANRRPDEVPEGPGGRPKMETDANIERGIQRVEAYCNSIGPGSTLYFLWSVERVGVALGLARIGHVDWYRRGAGTLLQTQQGDGSWRTNRGDLPDTSFALLFLRRSNLTEGMPQLMTGRSGGAGENRMRAGTLDDLIRSVRPPNDQK